MAASKILILKSSNGDEFEVEESIAIQSVTIKNMVEDDYSIIPLQNVDTQTLVKIIEYLKKKHTSNNEEIKKFEKEFVSTSFGNLFAIVLAANYLGISALMELICRAIADRIKNKSPEAVCKIFNVTCDYTPEEEEAIRKECAWAFGGEIDHSID